ncbi:uncharacterized protein LOC120477014 [Pimephales promelas]|uniref:uncharacterized protein LOC120477014 n=1 Tax=Pimephales promelas TaxID=90988 RepID=UPI001955990F|nr:uncharacterized protein LOC120477014 [Pimephales promelas]
MLKSKTMWTNVSYWRTETDLNRAAYIFRRFVLQEVEDQPDLVAKMDLRKSPEEREREILTFYKNSMTNWAHPLCVLLGGDSAFGDGVKRHFLSFVMSRVQYGFGLNFVEVNRLFASYGAEASRRPLSRHSRSARHRSSFTRVFCCLSSMTQSVAPNKYEREELEAAGLGEKKVTFLGDENNAEDFKDYILTTYPKLGNCGGFEILKTSGMTRSRNLVVLPSPNTGYTIKTLKENMGHAVIYIRPMQKDIELSSSVVCKSPMLGPMERCLLCDKEFNFNELKVHIEGCRPRTECSLLPLLENEHQPHSSDSDSFINQTIDLTEEKTDMEALSEWRRMREEQDEEYNQSLIADKAKELQKINTEESENNRKKAIDERRARMASLPEFAHGVPIKVKYPSGLMRTRKFILTESIKALFDFVGEVEDATEWFQIQEALSPPLRNDLCGTISERNIRGPTTLFVQWISSEDAEFMQTILTPDDYENHDNDDYNSSGTASQSDQPSTSNAHLTSFCPQSEQEKTVQKTDLQTILSRLSAKIDDESPTSNQINIVRDYKGNTHNILRSTVQAFSRRRFNLGARLDVVFVDDTKEAEGAVDGGGPTREYLRLLLKAVQQSSIFAGPENSKRLRLDSEALHKGLYRQISQMISVCIIHGGMGPHFFSEKLFLQVCGKPSSPATLDEVDDETFKEMLCKIKDAETVAEAKAAIEMAEDCLSIIGAFRSISTLKQRDTLVQSAVEYYVDGRCNVALQQFVDGFKTLGLLQEMQTHTDLFHIIFVEDKKPLRSSDLASLFKANLSDHDSYKRELETRTLCFWRDWIIDVEDEECAPLTLENVLEFASGSSVIPPHGFLQQPQIEFLHDAPEKIFPEANTCNIVLKLPIHYNYESFKTNMSNGILWAPTFGVA